MLLCSSLCTLYGFVKNHLVLVLWVLLGINLWWDILFQSLHIPVGAVLSRDPSQSPFEFV
jgi:hypothetical protein